MSEHRNGGSKDPGQEDRHENARKLTEDALDAYVEGDEAKGDKLVEQAKQKDQSAVEEVIQDLDEDAESDHTVPKENR